jgi:hypothetical protein
LTYVRFPAAAPSRRGISGAEWMAKAALARLPASLFASVGSLLYRHMG